MLHIFETSERRLRLWQKAGEGYPHILMKALGFAMFAGRYPRLQIEPKIAGRYDPDLYADDEAGQPLFWGECGLNSLRKTAWLLKHSGSQRIVLFKMGRDAEQIARQIRQIVQAKYRVTGRASIINFVPEIVDLTANGQIAKVAPDWFTETFI